MAHIGRGVADDAGAPMTAAYGADGHSHQRAASAEGSESHGGRSSAVVRERLFQGITVARKGLNTTWSDSKIRSRILHKFQIAPPALQPAAGGKNFGFVTDL